ncbi:MAG TPA: LysR family transcriptional regulator [Hyphomicrobiales bacterium]|nr:LysR family transcriptional regulator [Hyphomicrobiales bacterium]
MNLRQLQFVVAVAETRSFSRAAEACHATQPTLSNAVGQLEAELGGRLFVRTTRHVEPTAFGTYILPHLRAVLDARDELKKAAETFHDPSHKLLRIGFSPLVDMRRLDAALEPFLKRRPEVSVFYKECLLDDLAERLANDRIDIAIVPHGTLPARFAHFAFYSDDLFYLPAGGADAALGATRAPLPISALPEAPVVMTGGGCGLNGTLKALFDREGVALPAYPGEAASYATIEEWADLGIGAGILPAAKLSAKAAAPRALLANDGRPAAFAFEWVWDAGAQEKAHLARLVDHIRQEVPTLVAMRAGAPVTGA